MVGKRFILLLLIVGIVIFLIRPLFSNDMLKTIYAIIMGIAFMYIISSFIAYYVVAKRFTTCRLRTIDATAVYKKIQERRDIEVINVLPENYYYDCHIVGSRNIPLASLQAAAIGWEKDKEIILYCAHAQCQTSRKAYDLLCSLGFTNVWAYEGGMREWKERGLPTEGVCGMAYLNPINK